MTRGLAEEDERKVGSVGPSGDDAPFDEAGVLSHVRELARAEEAEFLSLDGPVCLRRDGSTLYVCWGDYTLRSPLTLVTAVLTVASIRRDRDIEASAEKWTLVAVVA